MKEMPIQFDDKSIEILKQVDGVHRHSLVNVALAMISKTGYYKTLTGVVGTDIDDIVGLESHDQDNVKVTKDEPKQETKATSWDSF